MDEARAAELVGGQFPELRGGPVRPVGIGWDNSVLLVGDVLFRFPRREVAVEVQQRELLVLPLVARRVPLPVPVPTHIGAPAGDYPWPFWGCAMLRGDELALRPGVDRRQAAEAAGAFLLALHAVPPPAALPIDPMGRGAPLLRADKTRTALRSLESRGLWDGSSEVEHLVDTPLGPPTSAPVLVHGDLHLRHLLVDDTGRATGVIDWGDTCLADPAVDLSLAYAAFDGADRAAMLSAYGAVDAERELRARALAVSLCAMLADWAADIGEELLLREYLRGIARAIS